MSYKRLAVVLFLAAILAAVIRMFFFETIRVTTPAMSENQSVGNRLIVEKFTLGARFPLSIGIPFAPDLFMGKKTFISLFKNAHRIPGTSKIKRNDLIAFNYPVVDDIPMDRHPILLSRCVGLPGEYIKLHGARLYVNDEEIKRPVDVSICYRYPIYQQQGINTMLKEGKINQKTYEEKDSGYIYLTRYEHSYLSKQEGNTEGIELNSCSSSFDEKTEVIPYKDFRIELNTRSFRIWGELINKYEGVKLVRSESGKFRKNGKEADYYIFKQNYYWVLNDHQGYLDDSRSLGLIPENNVIGKAYMVLFSPKTKRFLQNI